MKPIKNKPERIRKSMLDRCLSVKSVLSLFYCRRMPSHLQLATALLLTALFAPGTFLMSQPPKRADKKDKSHENIEWIWQYTPADKNKDGRENDLIQDTHFRPFLDQFLTDPQTFWGIPIEGRYRSLAN